MKTDKMPTNVLKKQDFKIVAGVEALRKQGYSMRENDIPELKTW